MLGCALTAKMRRGSRRRGASLALRTLCALSIAGAGTEPGTSARSARAETPAPARAPSAAPVPASSSPARATVTDADLTALHTYIRRGWTTLTRGHHDLAAAAVDPKLPPPANGRWPVYLSRREDAAAVEARLAAALPASERDRIELRRLPADPASITAHGLLYLPRPYVVPGGRFNEMYGWDSYFILRGLLRDGEVDRARDLVDDALYEVTHYGQVLNANRSYYLQRSQPPFLAAMVRAVHARTRDRAWLAAALPAIVAHHRFWTSAPHRAGTTGLSRYRARGTGPAPEVVAGERDAAGRSHYDRVRAAFRAEPPREGDPSRHYDRRTDRLTPRFYVADRSMRESGFDPTDRFGRFGSEILDVAPVCLNALLYLMETDVAALLEAVGRSGEAPAWRARADSRARAVRRLLWDEERGLYLDFDFVTRARRPYPFAATFFPLWVGMATPGEARRLAAVALPLLARPGGLSTSTNRSGNQWDAPFGWAPLQLAAVEGLRRYGLDREADAIALSFLGTVLKEFVEHGAVFEKYDVERRQSDVAPGLRFGYASNEIGFGWTNGVFLELEVSLTPARRGELVGFAAANPPAAYPGEAAPRPYIAPRNHPDGRRGHDEGIGVEMDDGAGHRRGVGDGPAGGGRGARNAASGSVGGAGAGGDAPDARDAAGLRGP